MKAKDYFAKIVAVDLTGVKAATMVLTGMNEEAKDICEKRGVTGNQKVTNVLKDLNIKWNAVAKLVRDNGMTGVPIYEDGFKRFWLKKLPGLMEFWK